MSSWRLSPSWIRRMYFTLPPPRITMSASVRAVNLPPSSLPRSILSPPEILRSLTVYPLDLRKLSISLAAEERHSPMSYNKDGLCYINLLIKRRGYGLCIQMEARDEAGAERVGPRLSQGPPEGQVQGPGRGDKEGEEVLQVVLSVYLQAGNYPEEPSHREVRYYGEGLFRLLLRPERAQGEEEGGRGLATSRSASSSAGKFLWP